MDNDNMGVPTGVGPRLPDPAPPAEKSLKLTRRETLISAVAGLLLVALATWFIVFTITAGQAPAVAVGRAADEGFAVQEEIVQVSLPGSGQRSVYFYISSDQLACALLQRRPGGWRVLDISGHLPLSSKDKPGIWMASGLQTGQREFFVFGLLYDKALTGVTVNGEEAVVVSSGPYRCWYYYGAGSASINSESVVYH